jgi:carboxylesterase
MSADVENLLCGGYKYKEKKAKEIACLLIHGFAASPKELIPLGDYLKEDFDVYAPLLPGHGTQIEDTDRKKYSDWVTCANNVYEYLNSIYKKVVIIGFSMGGTIALQISKKISPYKIITISSPIDLLDLKFITTKIKEQWRLNDLSVRKIIKEIEKASKLKKKDSIDTTKLVINNIYKKIFDNNIKISKTEKLIKYIDTYDSLSYHALKELLVLINITNKGLKKITSPILVIHSKKDVIVPLSNVNAILEKVSSDNAERFIVQSSSHQIPLDVDSDLIQKKIKEFITREI